MITIPFTGAASLQRKIHHLYRIDFAENAGTAAVCRVQLKDTDGSGELLVDLRCDASQSKNVDFSPPLHFPNGVFIQVSAGTVRGSITGS